MWNVQAKTELVRHKNRQHSASTCFDCIATQAATCVPKARLEAMKEVSSDWRKMSTILEKKKKNIKL
jgi:hypothetical protein